VTIFVRKSRVDLFFFLLLVTTVLGIIELIKTSGAVDWVLFDGAGGEIAFSGGFSGGFDFFFFAIVCVLVGFFFLRDLFGGALLGPKQL